MKYQGVIGISVRKYLGFYDGTSSWIHERYAVVVDMGGQLTDYKTGEVYDSLITRDRKGVLQASSDDLEVGETYALEAIIPEIENGRAYSNTQLDKIIQKSSLFSDQYKERTLPKRKRLLKK